MSAPRFRTVSAAAFLSLLGVLLAFGCTRPADPSTSDPAAPGEKFTGEPAVRGDSPVMAGARGTSTDGSGLARVETNAASPRKVALLVGVAKYDQGFPDLQFPEHDVEELATVLKAGGFEVLVLTGSAAGKNRATKKNLEARLAALLNGDGDETKKIKKGDIILVALCGHGLQLRNQATDREDAYFVPVDGKPNDAGTLVSISHLVDDVLAPCGSRNLLLVDACREIASPNKRGVEGRDMSLKGETAVLFSCSRGQFAWESPALKHGVFTHAVLKGLKGSAAKGGEVTWTGLVGFVQDEMAGKEFKALLPSGYEQTPIPTSGQMPRTVLFAAREGSGTTTAKMPEPAKLNPAEPNPGVKPKDPGSRTLDSTRGPIPAAVARETQAAWANSLGLELPVKVDINGSPMEFVLIPSGIFMMGAQRRVVIEKPFLMSG